MASNQLKTTVAVAGVVLFTAALVLLAVKFVHSSRLAASLEYTAPSLRAEWKGFDGAFTGKLKNGKLSGAWRQGGASLPLSFERN